jgi:hypothetical protein
MPLPDPQWFRIPSGEHEGRWHLSGWKLMAIKQGEDTDPRIGPWLGVAVCPRCHALVLHDGSHAYGDQTWEHEQWHAATDYPIPTEATDATT